VKAGDKHSSPLFLGLDFNPEDGGDMFLLNAGLISTNYTAFYPIR
jgi:hypothetical protein